MTKRPTLDLTSPGANDSWLSRLAPQALRALNRLLGLARLEARRKTTLRVQDQALRYDYYWYNADKKIDLRRLEGFGKLAQRVIDERRTYLKQDRLYSLWQAVGQIDSDTPAVAEVGAYRGGSARFIGDALRRHGRTNRFYVCDTFAGHVAVDDQVDGLHRVGHQFTKVSSEQVSRYLRSHENIRVVVGDFRETCRALDGVPEFALVHIDVDVHPITKFCLEYFADRLAPGGVMIVDDYGFVTCVGAKRAVDEFQAVRPDFWRIHLLTGQAILVKRDTSGPAVLTPQNSSE